MKIISFLYRIGHFTILPAFLFSCHAAFIDTSIFWPAGFFSLTFTFWLFATFLLFVTGAVLRKKSTLHLLAALMIGMPMILRSWSPGPSEASLTPEFRVASFNTFSFGHSNNNCADIDRELREEKIDVAILLEWRRTRDKMNVTPYPHRKTFPRSKNGGVRILSKYPIINDGKINLKNTFNEAAFADIAIDKDTIRFYLIHLESNKLSPNDYATIRRLELDSVYAQKARGMISRVKNALIKRAEQVKLLREHMNSSPYPIIIGSDLNDTPQSFAYQTFRRGRKDAFEEQGKGWEATYKKPFPFLRIDFMIYDKELMATHYGSAADIFSDHKLIFAGFKMNDKK